MPWGQNAISRIGSDPKRKFAATVWMSLIDARSGRSRKGDWILTLEADMASERHVKLFKNGRNQAVRIPREFELPGESAIMRKEGDRLIKPAA
jgi:Antidote-toxin recognition MazE, bacterial antitoxin